MPQAKLISLYEKRVDKKSKWEAKKSIKIFRSFSNYACEAGLGSRSREEPGVIGSLEWEPLEKKTQSRSRLEKKSLSTFL